MIRNATLNDAKIISDIYNYYIENTVITFEKKNVSESEMKERIKKTSNNFFWIVYEKENEIIGYAYISSFKNRHAYKNSVEASIYIKNGATGKGIGSILMTELIKKSKELNLHVIASSITLPNEKSISLHEKFNFEKVAHFKEIGNKFDKWLDVGYWQLII